MPYLMSSHPGSTLEDAVELAYQLKQDHVAPEQVQDFYPTPGTASTVMYYTGIDPFSGEKIYVADEHEKRLQRALLQPTRPENAPLVREALRRIGREDLIGYDKDCLIRPSKDDEMSGGRGGRQGGRQSGRQNARQGGQRNEQQDARQNARQGGQRGDKQNARQNGRRDANAKPNSGKPGSAKSNSGRPNSGKPRSDKPRSGNTRPKTPGKQNKNGGRR